MNREVIRSTVARIPMPNFDTDQIIPARFLMTVSKDGMREGALYSLRYNDKGDLDEGLRINQALDQGARVILAGPNFGCGSSREHAVWALQALGIKAIISTEFADIFHSNCLKNGLLPVILAEEQFADLEESLITSDSIVTIDLADQYVEAGVNTGSDVNANAEAEAECRRYSFHVEPFSRYLLLNDMSEFDYLLQQLPFIEEFENAR